MTALQSETFKSMRVVALSLGLVLCSYAEDQPGGIPQLSSRPGAVYTVYLDVGGFNYDGIFTPEGVEPGFTPALNDVAPSGTFNAAEQEQIELLWARVAQSFSPFDVNVTTVDPAVAAGQDANDAQRQAYYDATANMMHTVIGSGLRDHDNDPETPEQSWIPGGGADGTSALNVISTAGSSHTNFMLSEAQAGPANGFFIEGDYIGGVCSHENGHAFGLHHQSDYDVDTLSAEYSVGDASDGPGSWVPILGNASGRQRVAWRVGDADTGMPNHYQDDIAVLLSLNTSLGVVDDGIGKTFATATHLPLMGTTVDFSLAHGVIVPSDSSAPSPSDSTEGWYRFTLDSESSVTLTVHNSTQHLTPGEADGAGTLRSQLTIFNDSEVELMQGSESSNTLETTYSDTLPAGTYYAHVSALPPHQQDNPDFNDAEYYNIGAYFLTGSGFTSVTEPLEIQIVGMTLDPTNGQMTLTVESSAATTYTTQSSGDLRANMWDDIQTGSLVTGSNTVTIPGATYNWPVDSIFMRISAP